MARSNVTDDGAWVIGWDVVAVFGMGHIHVARQLNRIFHGQDLGHDADRDFSGCFAANKDTDGAAQAFQLQVCEAHVFLHSFVPRQVVSA